MTLSDEVRERLADVVQLQPTKNAELQEQWGMESGSEVHQYLETELEDYYYRDDNSLIRATEAANDLVDVEPGVSEAGDGRKSIRVTELQERVFQVLAGPSERSQSVVSVLQDLRSNYSIDPDSETVREALQTLKRKGVVDVIYRTVPTYRLAVERDAVDVSVIE
ncbi:MAG: hypothetical protein ACI9PP_001639 [Halobacteriales archaeon]|jgi:hypothetical protein